jgi:hypothetical protein
VWSPECSHPATSARSSRFPTRRPSASSPSESNSDGLSVRETERQARTLRHEADNPTTDTGAPEPSPQQKPEPDRPTPSHRKPALEALEQQLRTALGAPVALVHRAGAGRIEIKFHSLDELQRLVDLIGNLEGM